MTDRMREYYASNPLMVSSPFGGVDGINMDLIRAVFSDLGIDLAGASILDVGCGRGFMRDYVNKQGGRYFGVDLLAHGAGFPLSIGDATHLPFPDATFDGVFCVDAFEHIPDGVAAAREFRRVLKPNGCMFLSAPNYGNVAGIVKWVCERWGGYERNTWAPFRRWQAQELEQPLTESGVRRIFREAGFTRFTRIGHAPEVGLGVFPWTDHPRMPEAIQFRLQRLFRRIGTPVVRVWPGASLHGFWKIEV
ncbi:MAG: methyltransferase domain-containing protein [Candidatus Hydrogenedentes bacterium]|nr:methyltransferase domain-containing protein [Candidatus Hydrogenedentota bacterium]